MDLTAFSAEIFEYIVDFLNIESFMALSLTSKDIKKLLLPTQEYDRFFVLLNRVETMLDAWKKLTTNTKVLEIADLITIWFRLVGFKRTLNFSGKNIILTICKFAHSRTVIRLHRDYGERFSIHALRDVVMNFRRDILEYLVENGSSEEKTICLDLAIQCNNTELIDYLIAKGCTVSIHFDYTHFAAKHNNFKLLKWLYHLVAELDEMCLGYAIKNENFDMTKWLVEHGCKLTSQHAESAVKKGNLPLLEYLVEQGCELNDNCAHTAVKYNYLEVLRWLRENGCGWEANLHQESPHYKLALHNDNLPMLQYLISESCPVKIDRCFMSAVNWDHLAIAKYLKFTFDELCIIDDVLYNIASTNTKTQEWVGSLFKCTKDSYMKHFTLETLKWIHEHDDLPYKWDKDCYIKPMKSVMIDSLNYLFDNGCPIGEGGIILSDIPPTHSNTTRSCNLLIRWIREHNIPLVIIPPCSDKFRLVGPNVSWRSAAHC